MNSKSAIVFGGGGFIGTNLCQRLASSGYHVRAFGHSCLFPEALRDVQWVEGDLADTAAVVRALGSAAIVYHLVPHIAAHAASQDSDDTLRNIAPTLNLFDACEASGAARIVFISSGGTVYGSSAQIPTPETAPIAPASPYAASNVAIERDLMVRHQRGTLDYRVLRVANPYGPFQTANKKQGVIAMMLKQAIRGHEIEIWGDGSVVRDFVYIDDVVDALLLAAEDRGQHRVLNIGSGQGRSLLEVIAQIEKHLQKPLKINWALGRPIDIPVSVLAIARAREELGWKPSIDFAEGLRRTIAWWQTRTSHIISGSPEA